VKKHNCVFGMCGKQKVKTRK